MNTLLQKYFGPALLLCMVLSYCLLYAPVGINETDGGFVTAYAWRMLNGEWPYLDFIYVRPPVSLFIRYVEMLLVPEELEVLSERCLFYVKIALANYLGATLLVKGNQKWWLATLAFLFSAHNYPAAAWHTVDGVWLGAIALYGIFQSDKWLFPAAVATILSMLCKQSFYPLALLFLLLLWLLKPWKTAVKGSLLLLLTGLAAFLTFYFTGTWYSFLKMSTGATSAAQLWEFGIFAMFRVDPRLALLSGLLVPYLFGFRHPHLLYLFIASLLGFHLLEIYTHADWVSPMKISRLLWLLSLLYILGKSGFLLWKKKLAAMQEPEMIELAKIFGLLGLSWMTAISWGYNFPLFLSIPYMFVLGKINQQIPGDGLKQIEPVLKIALLLAMLGVFRYGYETIYRDEPRSQSTCDLGKIFPKLQFIKSSPRTCALYAELDSLVQQYGPNFKTLPSFPLAHYLTNTTSPWPIDWVTAAEIKGLEPQIYAATEQKGIYYFVEKSYGDLLLENDKFAMTKYVMQQTRKVEETRYFEVYVRER